MDVSAKNLWLELVNFFEKLKKFKKIYDMQLWQLATKLGLQKIWNSKNICKAFDTVYHIQNQV